MLSPCGNVQFVHDNIPLFLIGQFPFPSAFQWKYEANPEFVPGKENSNIKYFLFLNRQTATSALTNEGLN